MRTAREIAAAVNAGTMAPGAAAQEALAQINARDAHLQAWVEVDRAAAKSAVSGPLAGVPVGVKDIIDVAGLPTRLGAAPFAHRMPVEDAECVARLRAAGAIILGKTHTTQFAYLDPAPTRNPWNPERTPGGSSSGSAAAVAAGMVPLALGSQTVGSVLRPAAYCGVAGLKPTYGLIPYGGTAALARSFDHIGVFARNVADIALALTVLTANPAAVAPSSVATTVPRIGMARRFYAGEPGDEVARHLESVAATLTRAGAVLEDVELGCTAREAAAMGQPVLRAEAAHAHAAWFDANRDAFGDNIRALVESGRTVAATDYLQAREALAQLRESLVAAVSAYDAVLMPVAPSTAPGRETTGNSVFCAVASFTGLPAIALPSGLGADGLPLSVQLVAGPFREPQLLAAAGWVEGALGFKAAPPLPA
jgi:aspartyl-tRNA(Asn)/glutamyl-tRNA(Gln) amidotransferase subunit A